MLYNLRLFVLSTLCLLQLLLLYHVLGALSGEDPLAVRSLGRWLIHCFLCALGLHDDNGLLCVVVDLEVATVPGLGLHS